MLLFYAASAFALGLILSVVFQLAHCVEEADFPQLAPGTDQVPGAWAVHQVQSTVDFARRNRLLTWYLGGLNFQIEHHLFPRICHVHYPRISGIVQAVRRVRRPLRRQRRAARSHLFALAVASSHGASGRGGIADRSKPPGEREGAPYPRVS